MELWGGVECARVLVNGRTVDQLELTGHDVRETDLELLRPLGLDAIRYPLLQGRLQPDSRKPPDWSWSDRRLFALRRLGIRPVVTLVHHGTRHGSADLRQNRFARSLAEFAELAAKRYPWLRDYTPLNEPLTSARFSCLYGHWHPHLKDHNSFLQAVATQVRATILCMQAVRRVNPAARLIHTEDLGYTHSTPELRYQADYENERRWLGLDLLCGLVSEGHPFYGELLAAGLRGSDLEWFVANRCPPDVLGCNYYPTSERCLSGELMKFPAWSHGGNGHDKYADVHLALAPWVQPRGLRRLLHYAYRRYRLPLALTEVHVHAPELTQVSWFTDAWRTAESLNRAGIPVVAVCSWALFGAFEWNSLLTRQAGHYEPGAFDVRTGRPVRTALAAALARLAAEQLSI